MASVAFVLVGCSDNSAVPVSPTDQSSLSAPSLEKKAITNITMIHYPVEPFPDGTGITQTPGGIWHLKDVEIHEACIVTFEGGTVQLATMDHFLSSTMNAAGEGPVHGSFTMNLGSGGVWTGVWKGTYEGYRSIAPPPLLSPFPLPYPLEEFVFELPLKVVAHGIGGNIDGMKLTAIDVIRARGVPPNAWFGSSTGSFK